MTPTLEELIEIIHQESGELKEDLLKLVKDKMEELGEFVTELGATHIVAREFGVDLNKPPKRASEDDVITVIEDIEIDVVNITIEGIITFLQELKTFKKKDGSDGNLIAFDLTDTSGTIRVLFWDDYATDFVQEKFSVSDAIRVTGGHAKAGKNGLIELHATGDTEAKKVQKKEEWLSLKAQEQKYIVEYVKVSEIKNSKEYYSTKGIITKVEQKNEFTKSDGTTSAVRNLILSDDSGFIRLNLWDDLADKLTEKDEGKIIAVINGYGKFSQFNMKTELSCGYKTVIEFLEEDSKNYKKERVTIANIKAETDYCSIVAIVDDIGEIKEIKKEDDPNLKFQKITLRDDTGKIDVMFWGKQIRLIDTISVGSTIDLTTVKIRSSAEYGLQLGIRKETKITVS